MLSYIYIYTLLFFLYIERTKVMKVSTLDKNFIIVLYIESHESLNLAQGFNNHTIYWKLIL